MATPSRESTLTQDGHVSEWFARLMLATFEAYGVKATEARTRVYANDLSKLSREQVEMAFMRCRGVGGSGFFPQLPDIYKQIGPTPDDAAVLAWSALIQAASRVGAYSSIEIEDANIATALVVVFGSWSAFCATEAGPELHTKRQEFMAAYREARRRFTTGRPVRLGGLLEAGNRYDRSPAIWTARLTASGEVIHERERPALHARTAAQQLTEGHYGEEEGGASGSPGDGRQGNQATAGRSDRVRRDPR